MEKIPFSGRINQWNISVQREISRNLVVEAAYVGSRAAWLPGGSVPINLIPLDLYPSMGLDITKAADRSFLTSTVTSSAAKARGIKLPYAGYPTGATVAQSLRPFPQFSSSLSPGSAAMGNSWYDSLQLKATKRLSHGLELGTAFTWSKSLQLFGSGNNAFNRPNGKALSGDDQPFVLVMNFNYQIPAAFKRSRLLRELSGGWTVSGLVRYASGTPIPSPSSRNNLSQVLFQGTRMNRVPGEPLFLKDLNCGTGCIDPNKDFVLNPKAWSDVGPGLWGTAATYYSDYRYARYPDEQASLGKVFRIREGMTLQVRAEFFNVFNRTFLGNPDVANPLATQTRNAQGVPTSGFGRIDATAVAKPPRNGQLVARFQF